MFELRKNRMRTALAGFVLGLLLLGPGMSGLPGASCLAAQSEDTDIGFRWAFGVLSGSGNERKLEPVTRDTTLRSGDQLKMMVELERPCFVYVIYHNAQDGLKLLFPYSVGQFESDYRVARKYYIPQGDAWLELDDRPGQETFYLIASATRLDGLDDLLRAYESADASRKADIARDILAEIRNLRKLHREFVAPPERPVAIGGSVRGLEKHSGAGRPDVASIAEEVQSSGFVARAFTIEHK